jgi:hypothetical protein
MTNRVDKGVKKCGAASMPTPSLREAVGGVPL